MTNRLESNRIVLAFSLPLAILLIVSSSFGLITNDFYLRETANWQVQSLGQDLVDLFLVAPVLIISSFLTYRNNKAAQFVWGGSLLYLIYTFTIFCFSVHFNNLFIVYCLILGLSFYSFVYLGYSYVTKPVDSNASDNNVQTKVIGIYLIIISGIFYLLWLSEIVPAAISNEIPKTVKEAGLSTNPVHVLDLAIVLPGILFAGILLLKRNSMGLLLAPIMLTFFILMDLTIAFLIMMMIGRGFEGSFMIAGVMVFLALISLVFLVWFIRSEKRESVRATKTAETRLMI